MEGRREAATDPDVRGGAAAAREPRITRRTMLAGAGAAVVTAGAAAGTGRAHPVTPAAPRQELAFDIRRLVEGSELDPPSIQCVYDDINRMMILIGDIPFRTLLRTPIRALVPELLPRVGVAAEHGLIESPERVVELGRTLVELAPGLTLRDVFVRSREAVPRATFDTLLALRRQGIGIPLPGFGGRHARRRAAAADRVIAAMPNVTYEQVFTGAKRRASRKTLVALDLAKATGLCPVAARNNRRCDHGGGKPQGIRDACVPWNDGWCNMNPRGDFCAAKSDDLPNDNPKKRG